MAPPRYGDDFEPFAERHDRRRNELLAARPPVPAAPPASGPAVFGTDPFNMFDDPATQYLTHTIRDVSNFYRHPPADPTTDAVRAFLSSQLTGDPFTSQQEDALRARFRNQLTASRDAAKQRAVEDAAAHGLGESSGVLQSKLQQTENSYQQANAQSLNDLMLYIANEGQARKSSAAGALANLAAMQRGEQRGDQQQLVSLAQLLAQLPVDRLRELSAVVNGTGGNDINAVIHNLSGLSDQQQRQQQINDQNQAAWINALAQYANYFAEKHRGS